MSDLPTIRYRWALSDTQNVYEIEPYIKTLGDLRRLINQTCGIGKNSQLLMLDRRLIRYDDNFILEKVPGIDVNRTFDLYKMLYPHVKIRYTVGIMPSGNYLPPFTVNAGHRFSVMKKKIDMRSGVSSHLQELKLCGCESKITDRNIMWEYLIDDTPTFNLEVRELVGHRTLSIRNEQLENPLPYEIMYADNYSSIMSIMWVRKDFPPLIPPSGIFHLRSYGKTFLEPRRLKDYYYFCWKGPLDVVEGSSGWKEEEYNDSNDEEEAKKDDSMTSPSS